MLRTSFQPVLTSLLRSNTAAQTLGQHTSLMGATATSCRMPLHSYSSGTANSPVASELVKKVQAKKIRRDLTKDKSDYTMAHPIWADWEVEHTKVEHQPPKCLLDHLAYRTIQLMRFNFDVATGFRSGKLTTEKWGNRLIFLETVAGVPGSAAAVIRHLNSLRRLERDHGWIHTLLEEAENERMHLMTFLELRRPGPLFRAAVFAAQGIFWNFYFLSYVLSPRFAHKMVGYLEEEAVITYTKLIDHMEEGRYPEWQNRPPPAVAKNYWKLSDQATMVDLFKVIRADEAHHRDCNHLLAELDPKADNPIRD
jgi:Alternative oxidase